MKNIIYYLILFFTVLQLNLSAQEVTVKSDGKVGVGTTTPTRHFEISGEGSQFLRVTSTNSFPSMIEFIRNQNGSGLHSDWRFVNSGNFDLEYGTDDFSLLSNKIMTVNGSTQKIGFGNNTVFNPLAKIEVEDKSWQFRMWNSDPGGEDWWIGASSELWNVGKKKFVISPNNSSSNAAFVIDSSKNVGIGTIDPKTKLHVWGGTDANASVANTGSIIVGNPASAHIAIDGNEIMAKYDADSTGTLFIQNDGGITRFNGQLAIGREPSFGTELTLNGNASFYEGVDYYGGISAFNGDFVLNARTGSFVPSVSSGDLILQHTFFPSLPSGNVGIGTAAPFTKLHLVGTQDASYTTHGYLMIGYENGTNIVMDNNEILGRSNGAPTPLYIQKDGGSLLLCGNEAGQVGIGVGGASGLPQDLSYLLAVDGKIVSEELRVEFSGNWPDYVFADDYSLPDLYDLEKTLQSQRHLPNIPSASEIKNSGQLVGDMQRKMLEKIEELTLYTIQQQKQIDLQASLLEKQAEQIDTLLNTLKTSLETQK